MGRHCYRARSETGEVGLLQIIGWLGCLYLAVKGLEIGNGAQFRHESGRVTVAGALIAILAVGGALVFAVAINLQGEAFVQSQPDSDLPEALSDSQTECINKAEGNDAAVLACVGK